MNKGKFFPFVADIVFRAMCIACVSAVNIELSFGSGAGFVRFPVVAGAPTPIPLSKPSIYIYIIIYTYIYIYIYDSILCIYARGPL